MRNGPLYVPSGVRAKVIHWVQLPNLPVNPERITQSRFCKTCFGVLVTIPNQNVSAPSVLRTKPALLQLPAKNPAHGRPWSYALDYLPPQVTQ